MNSAPDNSYLDYVQPASSDALAQLQQLAEMQAAAESRVAQAEADLARAKDSLKEISERLVPELMDSIGIAEFRTSTGLKIEIAETIRASIPKARAPLAYHWLKENGHAAMIKRVLTVAFGKGEDEKADALASELRGEYPVDDQSNVHHSTLTAWVKEKLREGEEIPMDLFGVHRQRVSKIRS